MQNLFQKDMFSAVGWIPKAARMSALEALIALCGTVPGYVRNKPAMVCPWWCVHYNTYAIRWHFKMPQKA
jgi:hypothetical protein